VFLSNFVAKTAVTDSHPAKHVAVASTGYAIPSRLKYVWSVTVA